MSNSFINKKIIFDSIVDSYRESAKINKLNHEQCTQFLLTLNNKQFTKYEINYFLCEIVCSVTEINDSVISKLNAFIVNAENIKEYAKILFKYQGYDKIFKDLEFLFDEDKADEFCLSLGPGIMNLVDDKTLKPYSMMFLNDINSYIFVKKKQTIWLNNLAISKILFGFPIVKMADIFNICARSGSEVRSLQYKRFWLQEKSSNSTSDKVKIHSVVKYRKHGILFESAHAYYIMVKHIPNYQS